MAVDGGCPCSSRLGVFAYEEMPYAGKRAGITGRGLEGLTDGVMKVFGI